MANITPEQLASLEACTTAAQWGEACDAIKKASDSGVEYPSDWWDKVKMSGMMDRIMARWGDDSELKVEKLGAKTLKLYKAQQVNVSPDGTFRVVCKNTLN